jgi:hypothetical protein
VKDNGEKLKGGRHRKNREIYESRKMVLQNKGRCEISKKSVKGELAKGSRDM